jgi:protein-disulfide isomerase
MRPGQGCSVLFGAVVFALFSADGMGQSQGSIADPAPVVVFQGKPIYEHEFAAADQKQLQNMKEQIYTVELRGLHGVLDKRLIEAEAKKKGITVEQLFQSEVASKVPDPTDEQVKEYYAQRQAQHKERGFDAVKDEIRRGMRDVEIQKAEGVYVRGLMLSAVNDGELSFVLTPPKADLPIDATRLRGDTAAAITIVEFSDFSCGSCKATESTISALLKKYPGEIKISYRDFPLRTLRPQAELAAEASRCAGEQGMYWEYHDMEFLNTDKLGRDDLMSYGRKLKLDEAKFDECLSSGRFRTKVEQDLQLGIRAGVVAAPSFFVAGRFVSGDQPQVVFEKIIDDELTWARKKDPAH